MSAPNEYFFFNYVEGLYFNLPAEISEEKKEIIGGFHRAESHEVIAEDPPKGYR